MDDITLPVVCHRVFGFRREPLSFHKLRPPRDTVRRATESSLPESVLTRWQQRMLTEGTQRSIADVRKSFSGINEIWHDLAKISFQPIAFVDDAVPSDHALLMDQKAMRRYARRLNWPYLLNLYCVRDLYGAFGTSAFAPSPQHLTGARHYAVVSDRPDPVRIAAHELGHVLSLHHEGPEENLMNRYLVFDPPKTKLRSVQIMVARTHTHRYLRAAAYLTDISDTFREVLRSAEDEPLVFRSYFGEGLGAVHEK